jgi:hypothetical protein
MELRNMVDSLMNAREADRVRAEGEDGRGPAT